MNSNTINNTDQIWSDLQNGICKLFKDGKLSIKEFHMVSKYAYGFATTTNDVDENDIDDSGVIGKKLYKLIEKLIRKYLEDLKQTAIDNSDEEVLRFVATKWKLYKKASNILNNACAYLNANWITRNRESGKLFIYKIYHLAYVSWKNIILEHFYTPAINGALKLIKDQRNGLSIPYGLILTLIECIVVVTLKEDESCDLTWYKEKFERLLLEETERFYNEEGASYIQHNHVMEYINKVEERLQEEENRSKQFHESTKEILLKTCERSLMPRLYKEFKQLLELEKNEDLQRIYLLFMRNPEYFKKLVDIFYEFVLSQGLTALEKNCKSHSSDGDAKNYATTILTVFKKYSALVSNAFNSNSDFTEALNKTCARLLNKNHIVSGAKSSELIAQYTDVLLKKSNQGMEISELENEFKNVMSLHKQLENNFIFDIHYLKLFTNRLLQNTSAGYDVENLMLSKITSNCYLNTGECKIMLDEIEKSKVFSYEFQNDLIDSKQSVNIQFKVLSQVLWKIEQSPTICLPNELKVYETKFINFYQQKEPKRRLKVCYNLCNGVLVTNHFQKRYTIQANSIQISVLLQFNKSSDWTLSELANKTKIEMECLLPSLRVLMENNLLTSIDLWENLKPNSFISLNTKYQNKRSYIDLENAVYQDTPKTEENYEFDENRKHIIIQSSIIFILKRHQVMKHQELIDKVSSRISFFTLSVENFKECIDILAEKEFLERSNEVNTYKYLP